MGAAEIAAQEAAAEQAAIADALGKDAADKAAASDADDSKKTPGFFDKMMKLVCGWVCVCCRHV